MTKYNLLSISTRAPENLSKEEAKEKTEELKKEMNELQQLLYAEAKHSLLVILQGMDASGKDGAIRDVFSAMNPQGVRVNSFKVPTEEEKRHDYLWRVHKVAPGKGMIQIFNRSHYEDVLVTRVIGIVDDEEAQKRFRHINDFERLLTDCGTIILKFYLHISEEEQQKSFEDRLTDPFKYWKHSSKDHKMAKHWPEFRQYYQEIFEKCSPDIPWLIVPSDQNWYKEYIIAKTIVDTLKKLDMKYPDLDLG